MSISSVNLWSWFPIVAAKDLHAGAVLPAKLHAERLVVWRSREGCVGVWSDRCPHRGMSLSLGSTLGDTLVCPYHGWEFGADGNCRRIPAHPATKPSHAARARVYPAIEACGYVWACLGEPAAAQPECALLAGAALSPVRSLHVRADAATVALILLSRPLTDRRKPAPAWQLDGDTLTVTHPLAGGAAVCRARVGLPPVVACSIDGAGTSLRYAGLVQPTGENTAVVHLALLEEAPLATRLALNAALERLREEMPALAQGALLPELREAAAACAESALTPLVC